MGAVMPLPKVTCEIPDETPPRGELKPAPRTQANGMLNLAEGQRIAVMIAELYASGHNGTESTRCHGMLIYRGESLDIREEPWLGWIIATDSRRGGVHGSGGLRGWHHHHYAGP